MRYIFFLFVALSIHGLVNAQQFDSVLQLYNKTFISEKAYVHFDRNVYLPGENIFFKAYLLSGNDSSAISTNFYTELIDAQGRVLKRKVLPIIGSTTYGDFSIPADLKDKNLTFRGYTSWMLNFDTAFLFTKTLQVVQPDSTSDILNQKQQVLRFFPEGGDLVAGLASTLAFKATDQTGAPANISGLIKDNTGKVVDSFKTVHDGMGLLKFTPAENKTYYAEWKNEKNGIDRIQLPDIKADGVVIEAAQQGKWQYLKVSRRFTTDARFKTIYLIAQMNNTVVYKAKGNLSLLTSLRATIDTDSLSTGILQLTVFDQHWQPLAERITFINKNEKIFSSALNIGVSDIAKRSKNQIEIEVPSDVTASLSVSITDADITRNDGLLSNIMSGLLLTSDLRGYIHNPGYYFSSDKDSVKQHLDLIMLTNGWRRYDWKAIASNSLPKLQYEKDNHLTLEGYLTNPTAKLRSRAQINLILKSPGKPNQIHNVTVSKDGNFQLKGISIYDSTEVFYNQARTNRIDSSIKFRFQTSMPLSNNRVTLPNSPVNPVLPLAYQNPSLKHKISSNPSEFAILDTAFVKSKTKTKVQEMDSKYTLMGAFKSIDAAATINVIDDISATSANNVIDYIRMKYPILQRKQAAGGDILVWGGAQTSIIGTTANTQVYLNEMPSEVENLKDVRMSDVAYIKIFRPVFTFAKLGGAGGAVAIYTKRGYDFELPSKASNNFRTDLVNGYSNPKTFYSPDYATFNPPAGYRDLRPTLYWDPSVFVNPSKRVHKIEFYNNDISKAFRVIVEGIDDKGRLTRLEKVIEK